MHPESGLSYISGRSCIVIDANFLLEKFHRPQLDFDPNPSTLCHPPPTALPFIGYYSLPFNLGGVIDIRRRSLKGNAGQMIKACNSATGSHNSAGHSIGSARN
jgi:hypothetical protein